MSYVDAPKLLASQNKWKITFSSAVAKGLTASFRGAIKSFNDSYRSEWQREQAYGRMDSIQAFKATTRQINFSWQTAAADEKEGRANLKALAKLIQMLYPAYDNLGGGVRAISGAPLIKVKFANLIIDAKDGGGLIGTLDGIDHTPFVEAGFFCSKPGVLIPKIIDLECTFHPLHTHSMGTDVGQKAFTDAPGFPYGKKSMRSVRRGTGGTGGTNNPSSHSVENSNAEDAKKQIEVINELAKNLQGAGNEAAHDVKEATEAMILESPVSRNAPAYKGKSGPSPLASPPSAAAAVGPVVVDEDEIALPGWKRKKVLNLEEIYETSE